MKEKNRVHEIMNSLDGIQQSKAPRDGFAKIQQKLADQRAQQPAIKYRSAWMRVAAVIAFVVCFNIWIVSNYLSNEDMIPSESNDYPQLVTNFNMYDNE